MKMRSGSRLLKDFGKNLDLTLLALPTIIYVIIFCYLPLYGLILPFKNYNYEQGFFRSPWAGLKNFEFLFTSDQLLVITRNTLGYNLLFIVTSTVITVFLAILLNEISKRFVKLYQTAMFFPYFLSWVVVSYIALAFLDMQNGLFNSVLKTLGKEPVLWYGDPKYWVAILVLANLWKGVGCGTVVYYAAIIGIDSEYYESAKLDGASRFQQAIFITVPLLKPIITILTILSIGKIFFSDFGLFYNLPLNQTVLYPATDVIDTYVYRAVRNLGDFGMASAAGFYQSVLGFILVLLTNFIVRKIDNENKLF
jgi:ABC-type polysaccharide transport system, permease component